MVFSGSSCKKTLDLKPETVIENQNAISSLGDLKNILYGAFDGMQSSDVLGGNMVIYSELLSDDADLRLNKLTPFGTQEIYNGNTSVQISALRNMWKYTYNAINRANNVINFIDNPTKQLGADYEAQKDELKANALFIRAILHFELLRFWAMPYDVKNPSNNNIVGSGIVIRTKPTLSIDSLESYKKQRSTIQEVYDFVINDLKNAETLLSNKGIKVKVGFASSSACNAMLARVYYYQGDYSNARIYSEVVMNDQNFALLDSSNITSVFRKQDIQTTNNLESIFELVNTPSDYNAILRNTYSRSADYTFRITSNNVADLFDTNDYRRKYLLNVSPAPGSSFTLKYEIPAGQVGACNIPYLRLAEMYLTNAESKAIKGDFAGALATYNEFRATRYSNYIPETSTDNLISKIQAERRREFCFEGDRYMFLRKNGLPLRNGSDYKKYLFKIPQEEIAGNPNIIQN
jgi:hypothetical protein